MAIIRADTAHGLYSLVINDVLHGLIKPLYTTVRVYIGLRRDNEKSDFVAKEVIRWIGWQLLFVKTH